MSEPKFMGIYPTCIKTFYQKRLKYELQGDPSGKVGGLPVQALLSVVCLIVLH